LAGTLSNDLQTKLQSVFREVFDDDSLMLSDDLSRDTLEAWATSG
jgi:hypothetical protein